MDLSRSDTNFIRRWQLSPSLVLYLKKGGQFTFEPAYAFLIRHAGRWSNADSGGIFLYPFGQKGYIAAQPEFYIQGPAGDTGHLVFSILRP